MDRSWRWIAGVIALTVFALPGFATMPAVKAAAAAKTTTYSATETIPVPPASAYAGSGSGDGWGIALSSTQVFNVFHHSGRLQVACHLQADATPCWSPETITDASGDNFATSAQPGLWLNHATGDLYVYATRVADSTSGVVCVDTIAAATNPDPFCGFTALSVVGAAPLVVGISGVSDPALIGSNWYAFNYVDGAASGGSRNELLCFNTQTLSACQSQPFAVTLGGGTVSNLGFPSPSIAAFGNSIIIPISLNSFAASELACFDVSTRSRCTGSWPVSTTALGYPESRNRGDGGGSPFPLLTSTGSTLGFCLPIAADPCYALNGSTVTSPAGLSAAVPPNAGWDGPSITLGPRVYVPSGNFGGSDQVSCFDYSTGDSCTNFPKTFANLSLLYTVTSDPERPTCIWVNADNGASQIQNFDAYTGGACGQGPIRVLASSIVVPTQLCIPTSYTSIQVLDPTPGAYSNGTVAFEDGDGNPLAGVLTEPLDSTGKASLVGLNLNTAQGLPQFLITLNGASGTPTSVTVQLTWTGVADPSCVPAGAPPGPYSLIAYPVQAVANKPLNGANGGSNVVGAISVQGSSSAVVTLLAHHDVQVDWGDGSTPSIGALQPGRITGSESVFYVQAMHTYAVPSCGSGIPTPCNNNATVTVTALVGTTELKATAPLVVLPDRPRAYFIVNPALGTQNQVSLLIPVAQGPGQQQILGYEWTSTADTNHPIYDTPALRPLYACVINALILSGGADGRGTCQGGQYVSSFIDGAIQLGILPVTTKRLIGGLTSSDIYTIAGLWKQYYPQHIIPYVFPYFSVSQTSHVAFSLALGFPGDKTLPACLGVDSAVCYTVPDVTLEPDCTLFTAIFGLSSTCDLGDFTPRAPDYVGVNVTASAGDVVSVQAAISLVISHEIVHSPSSDDVFLQITIGGGLGGGGGAALSGTYGWVNGPLSSTPDDAHINSFVDHCTVSGGGGFEIGLGSVGFGGGLLGVYSPTGDSGFTSGFETYLYKAAAGSEASVSSGVSVNYALSLSELGVPLSGDDLKTLKEIFTGVASRSISLTKLTSDIKSVISSLPSLQTPLDDVRKALAGAQAIRTVCGLLPAQG